MDQAPIFKRRDLFSAGRDVQVPFKIVLKPYLRHSETNQNIEILCTEILRIIPHKRIVCAGTWKENPVIVKIYLVPWRGKRHCMREAQGINAFKKAGIKTPDLLYMGKLAPDSTPVLVFEKVEPALDFVDALKLAVDEKKQADLLIKVVSVVANQHNAGIKQDDLHLKNFLLSEDNIYSIDGGSVDTRFLGSGLSKTKSIKNLGALLAKFYPELSHMVPLVYPFYAKIRSWPEKHSLYPNLVKEVGKRRKQEKRTFLKKTYRECTAFVCRQSFHHYMVCDRNSYTNEMIRFIDNMDSEIASSRLLKDGNSSTVALVEIDGNPMVVKRYNIKSLRHALSRCFRPSRAWISWKNAHLLDILNIRTPRPIMFFEKRLGPFRSRAYYLMEYVEGTNCYELLHSQKAKEINLKDLVEKFVSMLQTLADSSVVHDDLKATNFIVTKHKDLFVLDLECLAEKRFRWVFRKKFKRKLERLMKNWEDLPEVYNTFGAELAKLKI
jgi:tRNA A-37 threonylcarbamoyl transferase component Bud32